MSPEDIICEAVARYERPLISQARLITGDLDSARDAVQETFLRLSRQDVAALAPRLAPWLFLVCRNCALDHCRKVVRFSTEPVGEETVYGGADPAHEAAVSEEARLVRLLVGRLRAEDQELLRLKFEAGLSYKEMSEALSLSVSNVGVRLHEAVGRLRAMWKRETAEVKP